MLTLFQGVRARRHAEHYCRTHTPSDPVYGSWICANEPTRFIIRVFCGQRTAPHPPDLMPHAPSWRLCLILAVDKRTQAVELVQDDAPYRPRLK